MLNQSAIAHAQRQLSLSEVDVHHFIDVRYPMALTWRLFILHQDATYGVNNDNHIIVGLPPPCERSVVTYHGSLGRSLMYCALRVSLAPPTRRLSSHKSIVEPKRARG
jgi:hypothetical protein